MTEHSPARVVGGLALGIVAVSSSAILVRVADDAPTLGIAFWRTVLAGLVLLPWALRSRRRAVERLSGRDRRLLVTSGLFLAAHFALFIGSLSFTTVASAVTLTTINPLFVAVGAYVWLGEHLSRRTLIGMLVTIAGAVVIGLGDAQALALGPRALLGDAMAFGAGIAVTGYLLIGRVLRRHLPNTVYASVVYLVSAGTLAVAALASGTPLGGYSTTSWLAILGLTLGPQLLGHTLFNALLSSVSATTVSIVILTEPVVATLLAWWLLSELPADLYWVGAPVVFIGVFLATAVSRQRAREAADAAAEA